MDERDRHAQGLANRRAVLGDAHVDRALAAATPLTAPFQDLITRYAWGEIWARPELPRETRRLLVLATTIALNRSDEFKMHVRAALDDGMAPELIREVILQSALYCGLPAANGAFHDLSAILAARDTAAGTPSTE